MLTAAQKTRCQQIAQALDRGDLSLWRSLEPSLSPEQKGEVWDQRAHVKAAAARPGGGFIRCGQSSAVLLEAGDLDHWADGPVEPSDDPDDDMEPCAACNGTGRDAAGNECAVCGGSGRAPADGEDDGNEDDDGDEEE